MRTPVRPLPEAVRRWTRRAWWLRVLDAGAGWGALWIAAALLLPDGDGAALAVVAAVFAGAGAMLPPLRRYWSPATGLAALALSQPLRPGYPAWHVRPDGAELVLVTARRGLRVVIAQPGQDAVEGIPVRRTRALLLPAELG